MFGLSGCFGKRYKVDYCGQKSSFEGARDSYRPGDKVELKFKYIATDTDYYFYVDGERVNPDYSDRDGYVIRFSMPAHDVTVKWSSKNSMIADPPFEEKMLIDYYTAVVGTDGYDSHKELVLSTAEGGMAKLERFVLPPGGEEETVETYLVPYEAADRCYEAIGKAKMRKWDRIGEDAGLCGGFTAVKFLDDDGSYVRVSTDKMPPDGERSMDGIGAILSEYLLPGYKYDKADDETSSAD